MIAPPLTPSSQPIFTVAHPYHIDDDRWADAQLRIDSEKESVTIHVHRAILSSTSLLFKKMFEAHDANPQGARGVRPLRLIFQPLVEPAQTIDDVIDNYAFHWVKEPVEAWECTVPLLAIDVRNVCTIGEAIIAVGFLYDARMVPEKMAVTMQKMFTVFGIGRVEPSSLNGTLARAATLIVVTYQGGLVRQYSSLREAIADAKLFMMIVERLSFIDQGNRSIRAVPLAVTIPANRAYGQPLVAENVLAPFSRDLTSVTVWQWHIYELDQIKTVLELS